MCTRDKEFTIRASRIASRAALTAPASSRSIPASSAPGRCSSPNRPSRRRSSRCRSIRRDRAGRQSAGPAEADQMRRLRRTKIVATLGPASSDQAMIARLFEAGADVFRINMSHTSHDAMRKLHGGDPRGREGVRPADRHPRRPAGAEAARRHLPGRRRDARRRAPTFVLDDDKAPGDETRVHLPHPEILAALEPGHTLLLDDGKVRLKATETSRKRAVTRVEVGGKLSDRKGVSLPDTTIAVLGADREGPLRSRSRLDAGVDWVGALLHPAARGHRRGEEDHARPRRRDGQDREAAGGHAARRDHRLHRRADGRARRSRRRDAARKGAGHPEADHARRAPRRQAGGGRDADAGIDDHQSGADARRSLRRRDRDLRGRRRRDAVGGIGGRAISGRGGRDDEPHRRGGRERPDLSRASSTRSAPSPKRPAPTRSRPRRARSPRRSISPAIVCWTFSGSTGAARRARAAAVADRRDLAERRDRPQARRSSGACIASSPRTRAISTTWWTAPAASPSARASPRPASASSSWPACRSARRAPPTWCGSRSSARSAAGGLDIPALDLLGQGLHEVRDLRQVRVHGERAAERFAARACPRRTPA